MAGINMKDSGEIKPQPQQAPSCSTTGNAMSIFELLQRANLPSGLSAEAKAYDEQIRKSVSEQGGLLSTTVNTDKYEATVIYSSKGNMGLALIYSEVYASVEEVPPTVFAPELVNVAKASKDINLLGSVVVTKEDYPKAKQMVSYLLNVLVTGGDSDVSGLSAAQFANVQLVVDTDINRVKSYIELMSPHGVPARCDVGVLVSAMVPRKREQAIATEFVRGDFIEQPIFAISAYTELVQAPASLFGNQAPTVNTRYMPIVTITDIVTGLPVQNLLGVAFPVAADALIRQGRWLSAYGFGANEPNLGNLILVDNKMWHANTMEEREAFRRQYLIDPFLAIDLLDGRARIPGIEELASGRFGDTLKAIGQFICNDAIAGGSSPMAAAWPLFAGTAFMDGKLVDTRCVDYLTLATKINDATRISQMLFKVNDPHLRIRQIKQYVSQVNVHYSGSTCVLQSEFIKVIAAGLSQRLNIRYKQPYQEVEASVAQLAASTANQFGAGFGFGGGVGTPFGGFNSGYVHPFGR